MNMNLSMYTVEAREIETSRAQQTQLTTDGDKDKQLTDKVCLCFTYQGIVVGWVPTCCRYSIPFLFPGGFFFCLL